MSVAFEFHMRVVAKDREGYYFTRWDQATPLVVRAANRAEAFTKAWAVMGECKRRWTWTAQIDRIEEAPSDPSAAIAQLAAMCDWLNDFKGARSEQPDHRAYHYGSPCPYSEVAPAILRGEPDPRRDGSVRA